MSPLLFIMVVDVLTEDVRNGSLKKFLYADDLALCGESLYEFMDKYEKRDGKMQWKGRVLRVNSDNKGMQLLFEKKSSVLKVDPCGVCGEPVGCNSI